MQSKASITELIGLYIEHKQALGYAYDRRSTAGLRQMGRFLESEGCSESGAVSRETVMKWIADGGSDHPTTTARRATNIRLFCLFLASRGHDAYVLPAGLRPQESRGFIPYIFSHAEIVDVIRAVDGLGPARCSPYRGQLYSAMVRVLYGCGLRLSEMRLLKVGDVDLEEGVIAVRNGKNDESRYVPMSESLWAYLKRYLSEGPADSSDPESYLFPSPQGGCYGREIIRKTLRECYSAAGIENREGNPPRVHDLRHTFAVHALMQAAEAGTPAHVFLPILATYMGHKHIMHTEYYLHLTAEGQDAMLEKLADAYGDKIYRER